MSRNPDGAGKGDKPRPIPDRKKFEDNWDAIFNKKTQEETPKILGIPVEDLNVDWDNLFKIEEK